MCAINNFDNANYVNPPNYTNSPTPVDVTAMRACFGDCFKTQTQLKSIRINIEKLDMTIAFFTAFLEALGPTSSSELNLLETLDLTFDIMPSAEIIT